MASPFFRAFKDLKVRDTGGATAKRAATSGTPPPIRETSTGYVKPGPARKGSFNAKTKAAVIKTHTDKHGLD